MQTEKNKKIGAFIMFLGAVGFFSSTIYFNQSNTVIEYTNLDYMLKMICTYGFALTGLYFGLQFTTSKKVANQIGGGLALLLVVGYVIGFIVH